MPVFVKKLLVDFVEGAAAAIIALNIAIPSNLDEAKAIGLSIGVACLHALVSAIRRNAPDIWAAIKARLLA